MRSLALVLGVVGAVFLLGWSERASAPARAAMEPRVLACGQIRCQSNADCPSNCGPCVTWSGTCALFGPR